MDIQHFIEFKQHCVYFISFKKHCIWYEFTATERGQGKLITDGYLYIFQKNLANDFASWKCVLRRKGHCIQLDCSRKSPSQYSFCVPGKESTTTSYKHCSNARSPYRVPNNNMRVTVVFLTAVLVLLMELLHLHQFKQDSYLFNRKIGTEMVLLRSALRYSTSFTLFMRNTMVESFRASLLSYPRKLKLLTEG